MDMATALKEAGRKARRMTTREEYAYLDSLSRSRPLTPQEVDRLYRAIKIIDHPKAHNPRAPRTVPFTVWTSAMDTQLCSLRRDRKPFSLIAKIMGLSKGAVGARWHRLNDKGMA